VGFVLAGQFMEGGGPRMLLQGPAACIVFGGTCGALLVSFPLAQLWRTVAALKQLFTGTGASLAETIDRLMELALRARRGGILALEEQIEQETDPFLRRGVLLAVDGSSAAFIRETLEIEIEAGEEDDESPARVCEAAGGYAPTLGIVGAVLGLIHVMQNLSDPSRLGPGIAVAFVATIYGVGSANLLFLPLAARLRHAARESGRRRQLILEGVLALQEGVNPRLMEQRLLGFAGPAATARHFEPVGMALEEGQ
jgi:chemotaxis protein MotA